MKNRVGFRLNATEMISVLILMFCAGLFISGFAGNTGIIVAGIFIFSAGILLMKRRIKIPSKDKYRVFFIHFFTLL